MRKIILFILIALPITGFSQANKEASIVMYPTNQERLGVDYEIKDLPNPDPLVLNNINLDYYDGLRQPEEDQEFLDEISGYTIIVYSSNRATHNKTLLVPVNNSSPK